MLDPNTSRKMAQVAFPVVTTCEKCGAQDVPLHRHHDDLQKPLEIIGGGL